MENLYADCSLDIKITLIFRLNNYQYRHNTWDYRMIPFFFFFLDRLQLGKKTLVSLTRLKKNLTINLAYVSSFFMSTLPTIPLVPWG
jgi:hypothetical protein